MSAFKVVLISPYYFLGNGIRILHPLLENIEGVEPYTIFFKHCKSNTFHPPTRREERLLVDLVEWLNPSLVCFGVLSPFFYVGRRLTRLIKRKRPSTLIFWGGIHPTLSPETCIDDVDMLCVGEGEGALTDVVTQLRDGKSYEQTRNLWINKGDRVIRNPLRPLIQDLDSLPFPAYDSPAFYFIDFNKIVKGAPMTSLRNNFLRITPGRGCPFACSFCVNSALTHIYKGLGPFVRKRSVGHVMKEIEEKMRLAGKKFEIVGFNDDNFATEKQWFDEFIQRYKKEVALPFVVEYHPSLLNSGRIGQLKEAGLRRLISGIECTSEDRRKKLFLRPEKNNEILGLAREAAHSGVEVEFDIILDNPFEETTDIKDTIEFLLQLPKPRYFRLFSLTFFPKYSLTNKAIQEGIIDARQLEGEILYQKWNRNWRWTYVPKLFPANAKTILQNIIWLIGRNNTADDTVRWAVFGNSWTAKGCLIWLNLKAIVMGVIWGVGGLVERDSAWIRWPKYLYYGLRYLGSGQWRIFYDKLRKHVFSEEDVQAKSKQGVLS